MALDIEALKAEIATIHSASNIDAEVTASVHTALETALAPVTAAQTASDARIGDLETAIKAMADQLTAGDTAAALATAQAATAAPADSTAAAATTDAATA